MSRGTLELHRHVSPTSKAVPSQKAIKKGMAGLPVHKLGPGRYTVPLLQPRQDDLPFLISLDLYDSSAVHRGPDAPGSSEPNLFSLQYILDGAGQVLLPKGNTEAVGAGDSILAPHRQTLLQAQPGAEPGPSQGCCQDDWQMASLTFLLPKDPAATGLLQEASRIPDSASPPVSFLSVEAASRLVAGAGKSAQSQASPAGAGGHTGFWEPVTDDLRAQMREISQRAMDDAQRDAAVSLWGSGGMNLRQDMSGAAQQAQEVAERNMAISMEDRRQQGVMEGFRKLLQRLIARKREGLSSDGSSILKRSLNELKAFRLPHQTNRMALVFDPLGDQVNFTFGVEIFEPGHRTTPHIHQLAHEVFVILAGDGMGFCDGQRFPVVAGDIVVFPPGSEHGIDVSNAGKMYCLEVMQPNDMFAELVRAGMPAGLLQHDDLCVLVAAGCSNV